MSEKKIRRYFAAKWKSSFKLVGSTWQRTEPTDEKREQLIAAHKVAVNYFNLNNKHVIHVVFEGYKEYKERVFMLPGYDLVKHGTTIGTAYNSMLGVERCLKCVEAQIPVKGNDKKKHFLLYVPVTKNTWKFNLELTGVTTFEFSEYVRKNKFEDVKSVSNYLKTTGSIKLPIPKVVEKDISGGAIMTAPSISIYSTDKEDMATFEDVDKDLVSKNSWKIGLFNLNLKSSKKVNIGKYKWMKIDSTPMNPLYLESLQERMNIWSKWLNITYTSDYKDRADRLNIGDNNPVYLEALLYFKEYIEWLKPILVNTLNNNDIRDLLLYIIATTREGTWKQEYLTQGTLESVFLELRLPFNTAIDKAMIRQIRKICFDQELSSMTVLRTYDIEDKYDIEELKLEGVDTDFYTYEQEEDGE